TTQYVGTYSGFGRFQKYSANPMAIPGKTAFTRVASHILRLPMTACTCDPRTQSETSTRSCDTITTNCNTIRPVNRAIIAAPPASSICRSRGCYHGLHPAKRHPVSLKQHNQKDAPCRFTNTNALPATSARKKSRSSLTPRSPSAPIAAARWSAPLPRLPSSSPVEAGTRTATVTPNPQPLPAKPPLPAASRQPRLLPPATAAHPLLQRPQRLPLPPQRQPLRRPRRSLKEIATAVWAVRCILRIRNA